MLRNIDRTVFGVLLTGGLLGVLAALPMTFDLIEGSALSAQAPPELPMPLVVALALLQNGVLLALAILAGMTLAERVGLRMPLIRAWRKGERPADAKAIVLAGVLLGAATGALLVALEVIVFLRHLPEAMQTMFEIPLWKRLLAGVVYGGVTEELLMRLFLVSAVVWLLGKWAKTPEGKPTSGAFWTAIVVVAILFGLGHLPMTAFLTPLTPELVTRALVLNGLAGLAFGWLYWRRGLEAAMLGHLSAHVVMQGPGTVLLKEMLSRGANG